MTYWFIADIENDYGGTYSQFIRAEDLPKVWGKVRGLKSAKYQPEGRADRRSAGLDLGESRDEPSRVEENEQKRKSGEWVRPLTFCGNTLFQGGFTGEYRGAAKSEFHAKVRKELQLVEDLLVAKNEAYGNAALDPVNIFSKSTAVEQIKVRIDDKLSRLYHGKEYGDEDTVTDLMGYLILLRIAEREAEENK